MLTSADCFGPHIDGLFEPDRPVDPTWPDTYLVLPKSSTMLLLREKYISQFYHIHLADLACVSFIASQGLQ